MAKCQQLEGDKPFAPSPQRSGRVSLLGQKVRQSILDGGPVMAVAGRRAVGVSFRLQAMEVSMCAICEGAQSLPEGEMPCEKELSRFGQILQQQLGEGPAFDLITQATGGVPSPSERTRDALGSLLHGIYSGRMKDQKRERKRGRREILFAIGLTILGAALGFGIAQLYGFFKPACV